MQDHEGGDIASDQVLSVMIFPKKKKSKIKTTQVSSPINNNIQNPITQLHFTGNFLDVLKPSPLFSNYKSLVIFLIEPLTGSEHS